jgi:diadenosine tetraphosphatase ApaH/serine/threonine PP2A family protein phosphatase
MVSIGGRRVLLCHGSPRRTNEFLWESTTPAAYVSHLCRQFEVDLVVCTHTGLHWQRHGVDGTGIVNVGAVGRPANDGRLAAWYTLLDLTDLGLRATFVPVAYDAGPVMKAMQAEGLPDVFTETLATGWWTSCLEVLPARERSKGRW